MYNKSKTYDAEIHIKGKTTINHNKSNTYNTKIHIKGEKTINHNKSKTYDKKIHVHIEGKATINHKIGEVNVVLGVDPKLVAVLCAGYFVCRFVDWIFSGSGGNDDGANKNADADIDEL